MTLEGQSGRRMPVSVITSAISAALVGFAGSVALVLAAASAVGASASQSAAWVMVLCLGIAAASTWLSIRLRTPIITAWSTPGAALVASAGIGLGFGNAVGAFVIAALLVMLTALIKPLGQLIERIPKTVAAAMLAGILLPFCLRVALAVQENVALVLPLVVLFFIVRLWWPNLAIPAVLVLGITLAALGRAIAPACCSFGVALPVPVVPEFQLQHALGLAVPLYIVTMASQNLAGLAVLKADGYTPPAAPIFGATGLISLIAAPFGSHGVCLSSITASICTGPDTHPDPDRRWMVGPVYGLCYLIFAFFSVTLVELLFALPVVLITAFVGLALLGPLTGALKVTLSGEPPENRAALVTFVVAASGISLLGLGAAPWGLVAGLLLVGLEKLRRRRNDRAVV
jgi:benzoate membrane transport protein